MSASGATFSHCVPVEKPFNLPVIRMTAGESVDLAFNIFDEETLAGYDFTSCSAHFSISGYLFPDVVEVSTSMSISGNTLSVSLTNNDTKDLFGRYIYQITIESGNQVIEIPGQGVVYITRNIDNYISA